MRTRTLALALATIVAGCGGERAATPPAPAATSAPAPSPAPAQPPAPSQAPTPTPAPAVPSSTVLSAPPSLRAHPAPEVIALARGDHLATRVVATAELAAQRGRAIWVVTSDSESLERWAHARADGTYDAQRRALATRIAECEDEPDDCFECVSCAEQLDDERYPTGVTLAITRISWPAAGAPVLDARASLGAGPKAVHVRELADRDADGRVEIGLALSSSHDTGQSGAGAETFLWLDGDTLHHQLAIARSSFEFGCTVDQREHSGFSFGDRNGDGRPDVGVRHGVWTNAEGCDPGPDGWPDPATCSIQEERLRFLYDAAADEWRTPDGSTSTPPPPSPEDELYDDEEEDDEQEAEEEAN